MRTEIEVKVSELKGSPTIEVHNWPIAIEIYSQYRSPILQIYSGGSVEKISDTEFVYTDSASGSAGSSLAFEYQIDYDEQQPLMGAIQFNGEDVCGDGKYVHFITINMFIFISW